MNENITRVRLRYPRATIMSDYNMESCWSHVYDDHDEDGMAQGNLIGWGQFEEDAWANAAKGIKYDE